MFFLRSDVNSVNSSEDLFVNFLHNSPLGCRRGRPTFIPRLRRVIGRKPLNFKTLNSNPNPNPNFNSNSDPYLFVTLALILNQILIPNVHQTLTLNVNQILSLTIHLILTVKNRFKIEGLKI